MTTDLDRRVDASLEVLAQFLHRGRSSADVGSRLLTLTHEGVATAALGGKHLRSRLVHVSSGEVSGSRLHAATVFGACVDLLHGAFLIHDDIIDRDDLRRGLPTVHAAVREEFADAHLGTSVAIVAGDLGITGALRLLVDSDLEDPLVRRSMRLLTAAAQETIIGETLDIAHAAAGETDLDRVRLSNRLKTSEYSFATPLKLGALAAGRDPEPMTPIAHALGHAYQAADDIAGAIGHSADTGKQAAGDVIHGRATLVTTRLGRESQLERVISDVVAEGTAQLTEARRLIEATELTACIRVDLHDITDDIEGRLQAHA